MKVPYPEQPHCADHSQFVAGCVVCKQARANFQPYPVSKMAASERSFGFTDDITESKLRGPASMREPFASSEPEVSLSLAAIRFLLRLIWPFSRII
jgi:hypothetical protein